MDEVLLAFIEDAHELLAEASSSLLKLERDPSDMTLVHSAFRAFHTIKGSSGLFEFHAMTLLMHVGEDMLHSVRDGSVPLTSEMVDFLLAALDLVNSWMEGLEAGQGLPGEAQAQVGELIDRVNLGNSMAAASATGPKQEEALRVQPPWAHMGQDLRQYEGESFAAVEYTPESDVFFKGEDPLLTVAQLPELVFLDMRIETSGQAGAHDPFHCDMTFRAVCHASLASVRDALGDAAGTLVFYDFVIPHSVRSEVAIDMLREMGEALKVEAEEAVRESRLASYCLLSVRVATAAGFPPSWVNELRDATNLAQLMVQENLLAEGIATLLNRIVAAREVGTRVSLLPGPPVDGQAEGASLSASIPPKGQGTTEGGAQVAHHVYKIDQARIDALLELAGELLVAKNALPYLARRADEFGAVPQLARELKDQAAVLSRIADGFHHAVMQLRIIPLSYAFDRFPRLVRDVSRKLGKQVRLVVSGETTEADKSTVERLVDPLMHIVRNSLDHGLETVQDRIAAGKEGEGVLRLTAEQRRGALVVTVEDDGRGIDPEKVKATAIKRGVITPDEAARLSDADAIALIFRAGFSTAETISDLSGRGVGMDVVRSAIEASGGTVDISGAVGEGTRVELALPLSMAVTRVLLVEASGRTFGVPFDLVLETFHVAPENLVNLRGGQAVSLRDKVVPVMWLRELLELPAVSNGLFVDEEDEDLTLLLARVPGGEVGIVVDAFHESLDIMLKPLDGPLAKLKGYLGSSLLGDGRALLVLNLAELI